jgi:hypothetical protein
MELSPDFKDFILALENNRAVYLLIGGYAVNYYGYLRYTGDFDIWVDANIDNSTRVVKAITDFVGMSPQLDSEYFATLGHMFYMGVPPMRIDVINQIDGVAFAEAYPARVPVKMSDVVVPVISLEHLRKNKSATKRAKDKGDLEGLPEI